MNPSEERSDDEDQAPPFEDETNQLLGAETDEDENIEGEELINDNMERDYRQIAELDIYEDAGLDEGSDITELSDAGRIAAEAELNARDRAEGRTGALRRDLIPDIYDESSDIGLPVRQRRAADYTDSQKSDTQPYEAIENLDDTRGMPLQDWVKQPATKQEIKNRFLTFLRTYLNVDGSSLYAGLLSAMAQSNQRSLVVDYEHLVESDQTLAFFLPEAPTEVLDIFDEVAYELTLSRYPRYKQVTDTIHTRVKNLPLREEIRALRAIHMDQLVRTHGVVSSCSVVLPKLKYIQYNCVKCLCVIGPFSYSDDSQSRPISCPDCQSHGPFEINIEKTIYKNHQKIVVQETPGSVPGGRIPRNKTIILTEDLVDGCKPGDEIDVTGIYLSFYDRAINNKQRFPIFSTHILANYVEKKDSVVAFSLLSDDDLQKLRTLSTDERLFDRIVRSIAPSIYGHDDIKRAIALSLFGGVSKKSDSHKVRGDINILLCGDPGTAKSQFLKFVEQLAPRCIFSTGQGASAVGLTANVSRNPSSNEFTLEAGALVLADNGVCLIDEFDKMNDQDRTSIHEAMEQQTISISKAGIVTTLQARCTIIAAANPIGGCYDVTRNFSDNVDLSSPILSRFDVICVVRDVVDPVSDGMLARYVLGSHMRHHPRLTDIERQEITSQLAEDGAMMASDDPDIAALEPIPVDLLRKYIIYAKGKVSPKLDVNVDKKLPTAYSDLRRVAKECGGVDVTMRFLESMIRVSEAHAKMYIRDTVTEDDMNMALRICLESFISTEKLSVRKQLERKFERYLSFKRSEFELLGFILKQLLHDTVHSSRARSNSRAADGQRSVELTEKSFLERTRTIDVSIVRAFLKSRQLQQHSFRYDAGTKTITYIY